jgi:hypothetical protein
MEDRIRKIVEKQKEREQKMKEKEQSKDHDFGLIEFLPGFFSTHLTEKHQATQPSQEQVIITSPIVVVNS